MDSDFRVFWLAPVIRNILGYLLFWGGIQNGFSFRDSLEDEILAVTEVGVPKNTK